MLETISDILEVLGAYGIRPEYESKDGEPSDTPESQLPDIGNIQEGEAVYATSFAEIFRDEEEGVVSEFNPQDPRIRDWWDQVQQVMQRSERGESLAPRPDTAKEPPEPHCAWYCPIHYFGHGWGIFIREKCILTIAVDIARCVDWGHGYLMSKASAARQLLRSAFYVLYLHEQFHHKVESFGFRLLVASGSDHYRPYKQNVYRRTYMSADCLEESLANAESYLRLKEPRYAKRINIPMRAGLRQYLKVSFAMQPPGYAEAAKYITDASFRDGLHHLQSQILDGVLTPTTPGSNWRISPNVITALSDITDDIYFVLPVGARPIFRPTSIDPGATVSSDKLVDAFTKHYGYQKSPGGKGSHVKLKRPGSPTIVLPGNRQVVSPGVVKQVLKVFGGHPISKLPDLLDGTLPMVG